MPAKLPRKTYKRKSTKPELIPVKFSRSLFISKKVRFVVGGLVLLALIIYPFTRVKKIEAEVTPFFSGSCDGGWENSDKAVGAPNIIEGGIDKYSDLNSASISNSIAQIRCGGFRGEVPQDVVPKKVILKFSWTNHLENVIDISPSIDQGPASVNEVPAQGSNVESNQNEQPANQAPLEVSPSGESSFLKNFFFTSTHAQENDPSQVLPVTSSDVVDPAAVSAEEPVSSDRPIIPEGSVVEVRYTLDGTKWDTLGYASDINNSVSFEIPTGVLSGFADLEKIQVALQTLPTIDNAPKIYLDAMWLNVEYQPSSQELSQGEIDNLPRVRIDNVFKPTEEDFRADEKPKFEVDNTVLDAKTTEIINEQKAASEPAPGPIPEPAPETLPKADTKTDPGTQPEVTPPAADPLQEPSSNATQLRKLISILGGDWLKKTVLTAFAQDAIDPAPVAPVEAPVEIPATLPVDAPTDTPAPAATDTVTPIPTDTAAPTPTDIVAPIPTDTVAPTSTEAPALAPITKANFKVIKSDVFDPEGEKAELQPVIEEINGAISISLPTPSDNFLPGKYKMDVEILRGRLVFVSSQDFTWGVLAINTNKSTYLPKEDAYLQMGTLSDTGNTICDANLKLKITNVNLQTETELSTSAGTIEYSKTCGVNNITDNPDYFAHYQVGDPGVYDMTLQKIDPNNGSVIYEIKDSFEVKDSLPFEVERIGATRINPFLSKYVMNFKVKANQDFNGVIVETVPVSMKVTETDDTKQKEENGKKYIIWEKSLSAGQTIDLSYEYQGAKISPQVYLLGPLNFSNPVNWLQRLFGADDKLIFKEAGQWQVASDSLTATWTGAVNGNWSNGGNWSGGVVPGAGDNLVFPNGASNLSNTNDLIQNTIFNSITFLGSGYTLAGNDIILGQGVAGITDGVASGGNTISLNIRLDATRNIFITNSAETLTISGMIGGAGGFNKEGTGKLILSGANTFAGATTINAGIVNLRHAEALGAIAAGTAVVGGAELQLQDGINIGYEALTLRGFGVLGGGALRNISGDNSFAGLITLVAGGAEIDSDSGTLSLTGGVTGTFNLNIDGAGNITFDMSPLAIAGATLTKNGAGTLKYNFPNTYTGTTVINSGTLLYGVDNAILSGAITVNNGTLDIATYSDMVGTITLGLIGDLSNPTITGSTGVLSSATFTVYSGTISAIIAGDGGALTKSTPGTVILTRPNLYSGAVSVSAGILDIRDSMALGVIDGITTVSAGATLLINGSGLSIPEYITISGTGMLYTGAIHNATGNNTLTGVVTLAAAAVIDSDSSTTLTIDQKGISAVSFALTVSGAGNVTTTTSAPIWATSASLVKNDAGTLTLGGYNNFTGSTVINDGIVILSGAGTLPSSAVTINSGATLTVDNSATDLLNRISSSAFTMNGGNFNYIGNSLSDASESAGALTLTSGHNIITVTPGAGGPTTMTFASLARTAGATALFRGTNLGSTPAANVSTLMFTTIGANLIGAAGAANSKTISVIKGGFGDTSLSGTGSDMVTYNVGNTNGLRLLNQAGFSGEYASDFSTINTNVKLTAGTAATTQSVNSLILNGFDVTNPGTGQTLTMASASLSGNILINSANNIAGANTTLGITTNELDILASASSTVSAVIGTAVAGSLTLSGTGNVTLSTASLYTGLTSVNNVTLTYGASNVISSGGVTVNNGTLDMGANSDTVGAVIMQRGTITGGAGVLTGSSFELRSGTVSAIIAGSGTTTRIATNTAADSIVLLTRDNTYSGVTAITSGILKLGAAGGATNTPLGTAVGGTTIATIGALDLNGFSMTSGEPITSLNGLGYGSGATVANGNSNMGALMNSSSTTVSYSGAITLGAAARIAADASVMNISSNISGAFVLTIGGFNDSTFSGTLSTITGVTKDGFGTLTLSGNNSYAGVTTVSVGDLKLGAAGGATNTPLGIAGAGNNTLVSAGAMLDLNGFTLGTAELLTINGTGFGLGDFALGALTNTSASAVTYSGLLTLGSASTIIANNGDINLSAAGTITGAGLGLTIGGSGNGTLTSVLGTTSGTLTKIGTGIWTLSGASTFTGAATIANGTIKLGVAGDTLNTPLGVIAGATTVNSGGVLDLNGFTIGTAEPITINGRGINDGGAIINNSASGIGYSGGITIGSDARITNTGAGLLTLSGAIATAGTTRIGGAGNITLVTGVASGAGGLTKDGAGTLTVNVSETYTGATIIEAGNFNYGASGLLAVTAVSVLGGSWNMNAVTDSVGTVTLVDGTITNGTLTGTAYTVEKGTIGAVLAGAIALVKNRQGTVTMTAANTISSTVTINAGAIILSGSGSAASATFTVNLGGTLTLDNSSTAVASRLGDALALTMNGGNFNFIGNTAALSSETAGALTLSTGYNVITITPGAGGSTTMTFASLTRSAGSTALFRGTGFGTNPAANISTLMFTSIGTNLIGAAGAANSKTISVIKGAFGDTSLSGTGSDMVTYNVGNTNGLRLLNQAGFSGEYATDFATANGNVKLGADTAASTQSINSLILNNFSVTNPGTAQTITLATASLSGNTLLNSATNIAGANTTIGMTTLELPMLVTANATVSAILGTNAAGTVTLGGVGNLTLSAAGAYTGTTTINNATLTYGASNVISSGAVTVVNGIYDLNGNSDTIGALNLNAGTVRSGSGTLTLGGTVTTTANNNVSSTISGNLGLGAARSFNIGDSVVDNDVVVSAVISGAFAITKDTGAGVLVFSGNNTYTGTTTINAGTLRLGANGDATNTPLGTTAGGTLVVGASSALDLNGYTLGTTEGLSLNGALAAGAVQNLSSVNSTYSGLVVLAGASTIISNYGDINVTNAGTISGAFGLTIGGSGNGTLVSIVGTGANTLTKNGVGLWNVSGASTFTSTTTISAGTLQLGSAGSAGNTPLGTTAGVTAITSGAILDLNGITLSTAEPITSINGTGINNRGAITTNSSSPTSFSGPITLGAASRITNFGSGTFSFSGALAGAFALTLVSSPGTITQTTASAWSAVAGAITKEGSGLLILGGQNAFTGAVTISTGTVQLGANGGVTNTPLGTIGGATTVAAGADLDLSTFTLGGSSTWEPLTLNGSGINNAGALTSSSSGANTFGVLTLGSNARIQNSGSGLITFAGAPTGTFNYVISGTGPTTFSGIFPAVAITITKYDSGILTLGAANLSTGLVRINGGTLKYGVNDALATGAVTVAGGTFDLSGFNETNIGAVTLISGSIINSGGAATLTSTAAYALESGTISAVLGSAVAAGISKTTSGQVILSGNNTFTSTSAALLVGKLNLQNSNALGAAGTTHTTTVTAGATLELQNNITLPSTKLITINGTGAGGIGSIRNVSDSNTIQGAITLSSITPRIKSESGALVVSGAISGATNSLLVGGSGNTTISRVIGTTSGTLTKDGSGTLILTTATNTYTGLTTINAGAINVRNAASLGTTAAGTVVNSGGALQIQGTITVGAEALTLYGNGVSNTGALRNIVNDNTYQGTITLGSNASIGSDAGTLTLSGTITGATSIGLTKVGAATVAASNTINVGGDFAISAGTLTASSNTITIAGSWSNSGTFTAGSSTVLMNGGNTVTVSGTTTFNNLTITHTVAKEVDFQTAGSPIFHITGVFTVTGHSGAAIKLYSDASPTQWRIHPTGTAVLDWLDVKDSACESGSINMNPTNFTNTNNGTCWAMPSITMTMSLSNATINFGTLTMLSPRYATSTLGAGVESIAHTIDVSTNATYGYTLYVQGDPLAGPGGHVITAIGNTPAASNPGNEQFGIRSTVSGGVATVASTYGHASNYGYDATASNQSTIGNAAGASTDTFSMRYLCNIGFTTNAGSYSTTLTYTAVGGF